MKKCVISALACVVASVGAVPAARGQAGADDCAAATVLPSSGVYTGSTLTATGATISSCSGADTADVWYVFTAPRADEYWFDLLESGFDTTISLWSGCGTGELACNNDADPENFFYQSFLAHDLAAGQTVYIRIAGWNGAVGTYVLDLEGGEAPPPNDACAAATPVAAFPASLTGTNLGSTPDVARTCSDRDDDRDVWYSFVAPTAALYRFSTEGSPDLEDTTLAVYGACGGAPLACNDDVDPLSFRLTSRVDLALAAGQQVLVRVAGWDGDRGAFQLDIGSPPAPPVNDTCATATPVLTFPFSDSAAAASAGPDQDVGCNLSATETRFGVWYRIDTADGILLTVENTGTGDLVYGVFAGGCAGTLTEVECFDQEEWTLEIPPNSSYHLLVGRWGSSEPAGPYDLIFTAAPVTGACCTGSSCTLTTRSACPAAATYLGENAPCQVPSGNPAEFTGATGLPMSIVDPVGGVPVFQSSTITAADALTIGTLSVSLTLDHTYLDDLLIELSHGATTVRLTYDQGDGKKLAGTYVFSDAASVTLANAAPNVDGVVNPGSYRPQQPLAAFRGAASAGPWTLRVGDDATGDRGTLTAWSLVINPLVPACAPACRADLDGNGQVQVADIFAFLSAWFARDPRADFNGDATIDVSDIFAFLSAWFGGC